MNKLKANNTENKLSPVTIRKENIIIPTYEIGQPEKYPIFLEKRVYQGSSGAVYPLPVIEKISDEKIDKEWDVIYLENYYLKIMILPALGGRIQMAYDKIKQRHFVYYNHVIKPALVGLNGPWISGGIEFNWPQHHRPSTYSAVDSIIEENEDGSKTVWVSEVERMSRTKGMAGFTLYPDKAYLEIKVELYNRTPHPQTFLWWANPAVAVNDEYQSVFPPDVNAVFDHGKRDVSRFPIATGTYYKVDYSAGVDISRYKNIPVPTSYMAFTSKYDFVGGYEHDTKAGLLHVADHHISPGKKQWTWGNGDFGKAWDRNLTDDDGPYIELMCGAFTDNQPDFTWIHPYEVKRFKQYFLPYQHVGMVKNATKDALINLEISDQTVCIKVYVTAIFRSCLIRLEDGEQVYFTDNADLSPERKYERSVEISNVSPDELYSVVQDANGNILVDWRPEKKQLPTAPEAAQPADKPENIASVEQLFLQGQHLQQYRHATYDPTDYYREGLKRDPGDSRNNNAMGLWLLQRGKFDEAAGYFQKAIGTLTDRNPNPYNGEPYFNLGITKKFTCKFDEAYDALSKSLWNSAWQDAACFNLAQLDCCKKNFKVALQHIETALSKNQLNHIARHLKIIALRKLNDKKQALSLIDESLALDNFNYGALYEKYSITQQPTVLEKYKSLMRDNPHNYIESSLDYAQAGFFDEAIAILSLYSTDKKSVYPMIDYLLGWYYDQADCAKQAKDHYQKAGIASPDYCFPNRLEEILALKSAIKSNPSDSKAYYYLGNFWYASKQYKEALESWEKSRELDPGFPIVHRNLALVYYNKKGEISEARKSLEKAFTLDNDNPRLLMELDQLYKKLNIPLNDRLGQLTINLPQVEARDDLYLEWITMLNLTGEHEKALDLLLTRKFHPWEGGEGKVPEQYKICHLEIAKNHLFSNNYSHAIEHLNNALIYPHNLGEGKLFGTTDNDIYYWLGLAYEGLDEKDKSIECFQKATHGLSEPGQAIFYNDQQPDNIFYQGMAFMKLKMKKKAYGRFNKLIDYGQTHLFDTVKIDYFAVSLPDLLIWDEDLNIRNQIHCRYLIALGKIGVSKKFEATAELVKIVGTDSYHLGSFYHLKWIEQLTDLKIQAVEKP